MIEASFSPLFVPNSTLALLPSLAPPPPKKVGEPAIYISDVVSNILIHVLRSLPLLFLAILIFFR